MYPVHFSISNISCLLITSEKSLFLTFIKPYNIIHEAQINTMDIILTIPIHNALAYTYTHLQKHQMNVN